MKSKNIPEDIKSKSIKDAQNEIMEIISKLESKDLNLEESMDKYNRMIQLNNFIQEKFREKLKNITKPNDEREKILKKD
tara:strand:- start:3877 stop:4113 length:237 start_codon:yes stop_codon:yes gene_type:complete